MRFLIQLVKVIQIRVEHVGEGPQENTKQASLMVSY